MISNLKGLSLATARAALVGFGMVSMATSANAAIFKIDESAFTAQAGTITFSEFPLNTVNPTYIPANYGGNPSEPTVTFSGDFLGQTVGTPPIPPGAIASGVVNGIPNNPLTLDPNSPTTFITEDGATPTSPVLSGSPQFNGPISILFSKDQAGIGLTGGYFNAIGSTAITAFSRDGSVLGSVTNTEIGTEFLGLVTSDGTNQIAGLQFHLVGDEPFGFVIDNLRFGTQGEVVVPSTVPEPSEMLGILAFGTIGAGYLLKRQKRSSLV